MSIVDDVPTFVNDLDKACEELTGNKVFSRLTPEITGAIPVYEETGKKFDDGKPKLGRLPLVALTEDALVYEFGSKKYDWNNWRKGLSWYRQLDAALRHIYAFIDGEDLDPESGVCHLAHARVDLAMVSEYRKTHPELDDRYKK